MKNSNSILILVLGVLIIGNFSSAANNRLKWRRAVCDGFTQNCGTICCGMGQTCCDTTCCGPTEECCGSVCCGSTETCCGGICCSMFQECGPKFICQ
ncbi:fibrous sheath-interacting protein 2-like [Rhizophagus irregularis DAOM 181602=DAOM 197198]|uniref:Uncharacterized protein n=2 Tax=Rhizophagus irregularis TaxID=588596 RepID=A0A2H5SK62_RHIID|nr:hypothetical protein GLOIN_2v1572272 [Rhizophagus irregularis DAOM 181602=DAOM 197198]POG74872.1 hypothetical protein GLOIN_2v1572272 [Rhizophagus irregularis DAOM 181602=DAOM 197198]GBC30681.1 fibrous sheath-interacting protein 2-like [Rhizophagus irregularis DAOM 181602=DAOM 197198]|eukprot:XP_025181738.1 hypothetical protein GLOIN_2v1572272 [Rhizophagus irregularis DAOM 181602=DAOM 197198]